MAIKLHHLRPAPGAKTDKVRVGRGEGGKRGKRFMVPMRVEAVPEWDGERLVVDAAFVE